MSSMAAAEGSALVGALSAMMQPPEGGCSDAQRDRSLRACEVALRTLLALAENLLKSDNQKHRRLRRSNPKLRQRLLDQPGGVRSLKAMGFRLERPDSEFYRWHDDCGVEPRKAADAIRVALKMCEDKVLKVMRKRMGSTQEDEQDQTANIRSPKDKKSDKPKEPCVTIKAGKRALYFVLPSSKSELERLRVSDLAGFVASSLDLASGKDIRLIAKGKVINAPESKDSTLCSLSCAGKEGSRLAKLKIKAMLPASDEAKHAVVELSKKSEGEVFPSEQSPSANKLTIDLFKFSTIIATQLLAMPVNHFATVSERHK